MKEKIVPIGIEKIKGIGRNTAIKICRELKINIKLKVKELRKEEKEKIRKYIEELAKSTPQS